jgi:DNA-binding IclR family transcriptional regulator
MTIHFHLSHFKECPNLSLEKYFIILAYEQQPCVSIKEIMELTNFSERTATRNRISLVEAGYLTKISTNRYEVTEKLYPL